MASSVASLVFLVTAAVAAVTAAFAPWLVRHVLAPGFTAPGQQALTTSLLRVMLLTPMVFGVSGMLMGVLNAHQHFLLPSLAPAFYSGGIIVGVLALVPRLGIHGLAWGTVLGAALHLLVQLPGLRSHQAAFYPGLGLRDPSVRLVGRLMAPRLLGAAAVEVNFLVNTILASAQPEGSLTALTNALTIMLVPQALIAQAMAIAALPTFSAQVARGEWGALRRTVGETLRGVVYLALPASLGLILLRRPLVAMFFQGGAFDTRSTELVAWALLWYAAGLLGHALLEVVVRAFYAMQDTRTPVAVGVSAMALNVLLSLLLAPAFIRLGWAPHGALALANSLATGLEATTLLLILRKRLAGLEWGRLRPGLLASAAACLTMGLALAGWTAVTAGRSAWLVGGAGALLGGLIYFGVSRCSAPPKPECSRRCCSSVCATVRLVGAGLAAPTSGGVLRPAGPSRRPYASAGGQPGYHQLRQRHPHQHPDDRFHRRVAQHFPQLLLAQRMPFDQIVDHRVDDLGMASSLAPDAGGIVDHDHGQHHRSGEVGRVEPGRQADAMGGGRHQGRMG